jgi:hypothetical protein
MDAGTIEGDGHNPSAPARAAGVAPPPNLMGLGEEGWGCEYCTLNEVLLYWYYIVPPNR